MPRGREWAEVLSGEKHRVSSSRLLSTGWGGPYSADLGRSVGLPWEQGHFMGVTQS